LTKELQQKARNIDDKYTALMWGEFQKIVKDNYKVKISSEKEIFIDIPKVDDFDIEIYPKYKINVHKFSIHLWDNRNGNKTVKSLEVDSLDHLISNIDKIIKETQEKSNHNLL